MKLDLPKPTTRVLIQGLAVGMFWGAIVIHYFEINRYWLPLYMVAGLAGTYVTWVENNARYR